MRSTGYLEYVKEASTRLIFKFNLGTHGLFEELGRHAKGRGGSEECPNYRTLRIQVEYVVLKCASDDCQRLIFLD